MLLPGADNHDSEFDSVGGLCQWDQGHEWISSPHVTFGPKRPKPIVFCQDAQLPDLIRFKVRFENNVDFQSSAPSQRGFTLGYNDTTVRCTSVVLLIGAVPTLPADGITKE